MTEADAIAAPFRPKVTMVSSFRREQAPGLVPEKSVASDLRRPDQAATPSVGDAFDTERPLDAAVAALRAVVSNIASRDALARLTDEVHLLSSRIDRLTRSDNDDDLFPALEQRIAALAWTLEDRERPALGSADMDGGEFLRPRAPRLAGPVIRADHPRKPRTLSGGSAAAPSERGCDSVVREPSRGNRVNAVCLVAAFRRAASVCGAAGPAKESAGRNAGGGAIAEPSATIFFESHPLLLILSIAAILLAAFITAMTMLQAVQPRVQVPVAAEARKTSLQRAPSSMISPVPIGSQSFSHPVTYGGTSEDFASAGILEPRRDTRAPGH